MAVQSSPLPAVNVPETLRRSGPWHSFGLLLSFPAAVVGGVTAAQRYLRAPFNLLPVAAMATSALLIYGINRFTDVEEDAANDPDRSQSLRLIGGLLAVTLVLTLGIAAWLWQRHELNPFYPLILLVGIAYSWAIVPWYRVGQGWLLIRLKDLLFVKSAVVAAVWTSAFFVAPLLHLPPALAVPRGFAILGVGFLVTHLTNVVFCDFRDEEGDRKAGVATLPVRFGVPACYRAIALLNAAWLALTVFLWRAGHIDVGHLAVLASHAALYPLAVWLARERLQWGKVALDHLVESVTFSFALCLWLLR